MIVALAVTVHATSLGHPFEFDDGVQIAKNPAVTSGAPSFGAYFFDRDTISSRAEYNTRIYRPLRTLSFRAVARVAGVRPLAFGLANLGAYALAALLVLALVERLVGDWRAALGATAIWVVLPVHVEPVAYYSALGDQLSLVLELGALLVALPLFDQSGGGGARWRWPASLALAAAAMLEKEMAVTAPAMLLVVAVAAGRSWRAPAVLRVVAAHAALAIAYVALRTHVVGAVGQDPVTAATLRTGLRDAPWLLAHYLRLCVMPLGHSAAYHVAPPGPLALALTLAGIVAVAVASWRWRRVVAMGLVWFALSLAPVLHLVPLWADLADRFALFPSVGLALALAGALAPLRRPLVTLLVALAAIVYAAASTVEARAWRSDALLWRYAVDRQPEAPLGHNNLAVMLMHEGRIAEAEAEIETMHRLGYSRADVEVAWAYMLSRLGRADEAARAVAGAERLDPANGVAHAFAGQLALAAGDRAAAARELEAAHRRARSHPSTGLLGYLVQGIDDARVDYLRALQALAFDDPVGAAAAARACLQRAPGQALCQAALHQAAALAGSQTSP